MDRDKTLLEKMLDEIELIMVGDYSSTQYICTWLLAAGYEADLESIQRGYSCSKRVYFRKPILI